MEPLPSARPTGDKRLGEVTTPTLVIVGTEHADAIVAACEATAAGIADATLLRIEGIAHLPNLEAAEQFNEALAQFLR